MPGGAHDFMVNATKADGTQAQYGAFNTLSAAQSFADDAVASGWITDYYITATDSAGNTIRYDQV